MTEPTTQALLSFDNTTLSTLVKNEDVKIVKLDGSVELGPIIGIADAIVDIVETGNTLKANGLIVIDKICDISTRLITNKVSLKYKSDEIYQIVDKFQKVIGG